MPRVLPVDWLKMRQQYLMTSMSIRELAEQYGVSVLTVRSRSHREGWGKSKQQMFARVDARMALKVEQAVESDAQLWEKEQVKRCHKLRAKIAESLDMTGGPIDPQALDQLTKAEMRVDEMGRRSLGIVDPAKQLDVTSGGMPLGAYSEAMRQVEAMLRGREGCSRHIDIESMASAQVSGASPSAALLPSAPAAEEPGDEADPEPAAPAACPPPASAPAADS